MFSHVAFRPEGIYILLFSFLLLCHYLKSILFFEIYCHAILTEICRDTCATLLPCLLGAEHLWSSFEGNLKIKTRKVKHIRERLSFSKPHQGTKKKKVCIYICDLFFFSFLPPPTSVVPAFWQGEDLDIQISSGRKLLQWFIPIFSIFAHCLSSLFFKDLKPSHPGSWLNTYINTFFSPEYIQSCSKLFNFLSSDLSSKIAYIITWQTSQVTFMNGWNSSP